LFSGKSTRQSVPEAIPSQVIPKTLSSIYLQLESYIDRTRGDCLLERDMLRSPNTLESPMQTGRDYPG